MPEGLVGRPGGACSPMEEAGVLGSMGVRGNCRPPVSLEVGWALVRLRGCWGVGGGACVCEHSHHWSCGMDMAIDLSTLPLFS